MNQLKNNPKISVVTVVFNGEQYIERTIQSVKNQTYSNIEYIVIDGASKDNTLKIIEKYKAFINNIISEPDKGIYDAMNKGLQAASGDYIVFMNAGDQFYEEDTLLKIFSGEASADVFYGDTIIIDEENKSLNTRRLRPPKALTWKSFKMGMLVCHQAFIVRRAIADKYDLQYRIAADIDWCINCLKRANKIENTKLFITRYQTGGTSVKHQKRALKERFKIMKKHYGLLQTVIFHFFILIRAFQHQYEKRR